MIKAFCDLNYSVKEVFRAIWDTDVRTKWDNLFTEFRLVHTQPTHEYIYYCIKTPFGITRRDWLQKRVYIEDFPEPGGLTMHFVSEAHPCMPPRPKIIRAETLVSGYILRPTGPKSCKVTIITQNDIKGLIPTSIVNRVAAKAPLDWVTNLQKGCKIIQERGY